MKVVLSGMEELESSPIPVLTHSFPTGLHYVMGIAIVTCIEREGISVDRSRIGNNRGISFRNLKTEEAPCGEARAWYML